MPWLTSRLLVWTLYALYLLFVVEIVLRLALSSAQITWQLGGDTQATWKRMWLSRHAAGTEIYYGFDRFDERRGWASRPSLRNEQVFGDKVLNTNAAGFRGTREYALEKQPKTLRIAVLGDSFAFGDEVSDDETYPAQLQRAMRDAEVINMGVHGYGHDQMLLLFEEEGMRYRPDIVVLSFVAADVARNLLTFRDYAKPSFLLESGTLRLRGVPVPRPEHFLREHRFQPSSLALLEILRERFSRDPNTLRSQAHKLTAAILDRLGERCRAIEATYLLFYIPTYSEVEEPTLWAAERDFFDSYCSRERRVSCASALPSFLDQVDRGQSFEHTGHWDAAGNQVIAESLRTHLCERTPRLCEAPIGAGG